MSDPCIVDARFAGGHIAVTAVQLAHSPEHHVVSAVFPGFEVVLFAHEARELAAALLEHAEAADVATLSGGCEPPC